MFPAGKQLPQLQQLLLHSDHWHGFECLVTADDLPRMLRACPGLRSLQLTDVLEADADVSALLQLPSTCVSLRVAGDPFKDRAARVLAQLTQLTALEWDWAEGMTLAGLQPLTALQALQLFRMRGGLEREPGEDGTFELNAGEKVRPQQPLLGAPAWWES
jgi:hypothetical protein